MESSAATQPRARARSRKNSVYLTRRAEIAGGGELCLRLESGDPPAKWSEGAFRSTCASGELLGRVEQAVACVADDHVDRPSSGKLSATHPRCDTTSNTRRSALASLTHRRILVRRPSPVGHRRSVVLAEPRFSSEDGSEVFDSAIRHSLDVLGRQTLCARRRPGATC
jgi:hypothetical protein